MLATKGFGQMFMKRVDEASNPMLTFYPVSISKAVKGKVAYEPDPKYSGDYMEITKEESRYVKSKDALIVYFSELFEEYDTKKGKIYQLPNYDGWYMKKSDMVKESSINESRTEVENWKGGSSVFNIRVAAVMDQKTKVTLMKSKDGDRGRFNDSDNPRTMWTWNNKGDKVTLKMDRNDGALLTFNKSDLMLEDSNK